MAEVVCGSDGRELSLVKATIALDVARLREQTVVAAGRFLVGNVSKAQYNTVVLLRERKDPEFLSPKVRRLEVPI